MREEESSGVISNCSNLVITNAFMKESSSLQQNNKEGAYLKSFRISDNDDSKATKNANEDMLSSDSSLDDDEILTDIPADSCLNSLERGFDPNYKPNNTLDYDNARIPKEENLL